MPDEQLPRIPRLKDLEPALYQGRLLPIHRGGQVVNHDAVVYVSRHAHVAQLRLREDLYARSTGHEWGYTGAGPAQLAFDILMDFLGDLETTRRYHPAFTDALALRTPHREEWDLSAKDILDLLDSINRDKGWA